MPHFLSAVRCSPNRCRKRRQPRQLSIRTPRASLSESWRRYTVRERRIPRRTHGGHNVSGKPGVRLKDDLTVCTVLLRIPPVLSAKVANGLSAGGTIAGVHDDTNFWCQGRDQNIRTDRYRERIMHARRPFPERILGEECKIEVQHSTNIPRDLSVTIKKLLTVSFGEKCTHGHI